MPAAPSSRLFSLLSLLLLSRDAYAQTAGTFKVAGSTQVSAMMMFLGNDQKVYILDKAENNAAQVKGHAAWASVWDIPSSKAEVVDVISNAFCAAGALLPNSSWVTFGGNHAVDPDASQSSGVSDYKLPAGQPLAPSDVYEDVDGRKAIRVVTPTGCSGHVASWGPECQWYDDPATLSMLKERWYATAESLADGSVLLIGGMVNGGYINRDGTTSDPVTQHGQAQNTYEYYPRRASLPQPKTSDFLVKAGGLNTYAHAFLLKSGKMLLQANISTITLDTDTLAETSLPDMPDNIVRVYPASGGVAMLPLTPANNYNPTLLFCGGTNALTDFEWGNYGNPMANTWERRASTDCQRLTPEPEDGSAVAYAKDDDMLDPRTMGQFIIMPDGKLLMINGGKNGTAGYTTQTKALTFEELPFGMSLAAEEVLTPAIYDPEAPAGQRWSDAGLGSAKHPRLYHSTAILLPDGSVMVAGSNPGADVVTPETAPPNFKYFTTYEAEIFYPPYFANISSRPVVASGTPTTLSYGGAYFTVTLSNKYASPNDAAASAKVVLLRSGFSTHAMNMGQRYMQLNSTYSVADDGTITLSVSPPPPNANLLVPGPALFFVVVDGVPSVGTHVVVGNGAMGKQPTNALVALPPNAPNPKLALSDNGGTGGTGGDGKDNTKKTGISTGAIVGIAVAAVALVVLGAVALFFCCRRKKVAYTGVPISQPAMRGYDAEGAAAAGMGAGAYRGGETASDVNLPPVQPRNYDRFTPSPRPSQ